MHLQVQRREKRMVIYRIHFLIVYIHVLLHRTTKQYPEPIQVTVEDTHMDQEEVVTTAKY